MEHNWRKLIAIISAVVMIFTTGVSTPVQAASSNSITLTVEYGQTEARAMLQRINNFRTSEEAWEWSKDGQKIYHQGLQELKYDPVLEEVAMQRAAELVVKYSHTRPNGENCFSAFPGGVYSACGENIARGQQTEEIVFTGWSEENEPYAGQGHRRNMLSENFNAIGIGHVIYNGTHYWVQEFGKSNSDIGSLPSALDESKEVSIPMSNAEQTVQSVSVGYPTVYCDAKNTPDQLQAFASTLSSMVVTVSFSSGGSVSYPISAQWIYDEGSSSLIPKSYVLPDGVSDPNGVLEKGVEVDGSLKTTGWWSGVHQLKEGDKLNLSFGPYYSDATIVSWYKLDSDGKLNLLASGSDRSFSKEKVTTEDAGNYIVSYVQPYAGIFLSSAYSVSVAAHTHSWNEGEETTAPTCGKDGIKTYTCTECGETKTESIAATGEHSFDNGTVIKAPTCTEEGEKKLTCTVCGFVQTESVPATGHNPIETAGVKATCTTSGKTSGSVCSVCGVVLIEQKEIPATGHSWSDWEITKKATCQEEGLKTSVCVQCGEKQTEVIPLAPHTEVIDQESTATCTTGGKTEGSHCSVCGQVLSEPKDIPALGHDWDDGKITTESTCTEEGIKTITCRRCNETKTETIPATGHKEVIDAAQKATCTQEGKTQGSHCSVCGEVIIKQEIIPVLSHTEVKDSAKDATCTEKGLTEGSHCSVCGTVLVEQKEIAPLGHDWDQGVVTKNATCTETGKRTYTCKTCGETKDEEIPATGHSFDDGVITTEPTCTETGVRTYTCTKCGTKKMETIDKIPHTPKKLEEIPATCTTDGKTAGSVCAVCGTILTPQNVISALGHDWNSEGTVSAKPTCTEAGAKIFKCTRCDETKTEAIDATGHTEEIMPGKAATCKESGLTEGVKCSICGVILKEQTIIPISSEHSWDKGKVVTEATCTKDGSILFTCTVCGETKTEAIEALGHKEEVIPGKAATCKDTGLTEGVKCSVCGTILGEQSVIPVSNEHSWDEGKIVTEATCTGDGSMLFTCTVCGETKTEAIKALGHKEEIIPGKAATCKDTGLTEGKKCSVCGEILEEQKVISVSKEHTWDAGTIVKKATCTEKGEIRYTCTVCGEVKNEEVKAVGHTEVIDPAIEATTDHTGLTEGSHCSVCGQIIKAQKEIPKVSKPTSTDKDTSNNNNSKDTTNPKNGDSTSPKTSNTTNPKTGDTTNLSMTLAMLFVSVSALAMLITVKKKKTAK